jgi:hypothetical protein
MFNQTHSIHEYVFRFLEQIIDTPNDAAVVPNAVTTDGSESTEDTERYLSGQEFNHPVDYVSRVRNPHLRWVFGTVGTPLYRDYSAFPVFQDQSAVLSMQDEMALASQMQPHDRYVLPGPNELNAHRYQLNPRWNGPHQHISMSFPRSYHQHLNMGGDGLVPIYVPVPYVAHNLGNEEVAVSREQFR